MIHSLPWMDLSYALQEEIVHQMFCAFDRPWSPHVRKRFLRPSTQVQLFYEEGTWKGVCLSWKEHGAQVRYLDKLYVLPCHRGKGQGRQLLGEWATGTNDRWIWRTDEALATGYYGKQPPIRRILTIGSYVYMGIDSNRRRPWEAEDWMPFVHLPSAFSTSAS